MTGAHLVVNGIGMRFAGIQVLDDVGFVAEPGEVHAIIGPNGAGKSTLFSVLSGLYRPHSGGIRLDGEEILGLAPHRIVRRGVGRAFQNGSMFSGLTVEENLLLGRHRLMRAGVIAGGLRLPGVRAEERAARAAVREHAEFLGVEHLLDQQAGELSYGDAKRVDVARALCTEPTLLLLDEPAAGTHTHEKIAMRDTIRRIAHERGTTILLVEHDMGVVMGASDRITVLNFGTVLASGTPSEVRNDPGVIEAYLGHTSAREEALAATTRRKHA